MAGYVPPVGQVDLTLKSGYVPAIGTVDLVLGPETDNDRTLAVNARTGSARAQIRIRQTSRLAVSARTGGARGVVRVAYDPNLLSQVHAVAASPWSEAKPAPTGIEAPWRASIRLPGAGIECWRTAGGLTGARIGRWRSSEQLGGGGIERWRDARPVASDARETWRSSPRVANSGIGRWRDAAPLDHTAAAAWIMTLPLIVADRRTPWSQAGRLLAGFTDLAGDGARLLGVEIERWRPAGYPSNAPNPGPILPPVDGGYRPPVGRVDLVLCRRPARLDGVELVLGPRRCAQVARVVIPVQKVYRVLNSCSLVRLPDRAPLAVTSMTVDTDADSWCWALSATLAGPEGEALLRPRAPAYLPVEVEATINGHVWRFLLDLPNATRRFVNHRQALKGRSRSAWLAEPFTARSNGVETQPRTAQQLAEQALENLGWTLDWRLPAEWLIPGGLYSWNATPVEQLIALVKPVDGCLYTHPAQSILTAYPRYPTPAWLWPGQVADIGIPEAAIIGLDRTPDHRSVLNGCHVSGTLYGYTAWVKVAGTDGALVPDEPTVDPLLCHTDALRARGISILSASGTGETLGAEMLLTPDGGSGPGLLRPGLLADIAGTKGMVRGVRVTAEWAQGLKVRQHVALEKREVEA